MISMYFRSWKYFSHFPFSLFRQKCHKNGDRPELERFQTLPLQRNRAWAGNAMTVILCEELHPSATNPTEPTLPTAFHYHWETHISLIVQFFLHDLEAIHKPFILHCLILSPYLVPSALYSLKKWFGRECFSDNGSKMAFILKQKSNVALCVQVESLLCFMQGKQNREQYEPFQIINVKSVK